MQIAVAAKGQAQNIDCRSCHASGKSAADFSVVYANAMAHHPVDIRYPLGSNENPNFNQPDGQSADTTFFDKNGSGLPDGDEIQLFSVNGAATITCSSCHKEHGTKQLPAIKPVDSYLRVKLAGSELCSVCHAQ